MRVFMYVVRVLSLLGRFEVRRGKIVGRTLWDSDSRKANTETHQSAESDVCGPRAQTRVRQGYGFTVRSRRTAYTEWYVVR